MKNFFVLLVGLSFSVFLFTNNASFALEESDNWDAYCSTILDGAGSSIAPVGANSYCYGRAANGGSRTTTNTSAQNPNPESYLIKNNLKMGSRDSSTNGDVTRLQAFLIQIGYLSSAPTGYFGTATRKAVIKYQKSKGLTAEGFVGGLTRNMISSESRSGNSISGSSVNTYNTGETNPSSGSIACRYATPPEGCSFVKGKEYNSTNNCGMVLSCKSESEAQYLCDYTAPREGCKLVPGPNYNPKNGCGRILACNTKPTDPTDTIGATATPSITVLSPNGGEVYKPGQQITITWKSTGLSSTDNVYIGIIGDDNTSICVEALVKVSNTGSFIYTIPDPGVSPDIRSGRQCYNTSYGNHFKVNVQYYNVDRDTFWDHSDNLFTITTPTATGATTSSCTPTSTPSITILSPKGDEIYKIKDKINVKWTSCNLPVGTGIYAQLHNTNTISESTLIPDTIVTTGSFSNVSTITQNDGEENFYQQASIIVNPNIIGGFGKHFKIRLLATDSIYNIRPTAEIYSTGLFSIVSSDSSSLTVTSPNGGESYKAGGDILVKWSTNNVSSTDKIKLGLIYNGGGGGSAGDVWLSNLAGSQSFLNDGSETVQIPKNLPWASVNEWFSGNHYTISAEIENSTLRDVSDNLFTIDAGRMIPIDYNSPCTGNTITVKEDGLINSGGTAIFSKLGMNISSHPEILKYRIQWFNGTWSPWYVPGVEDQDWKNNYDGSERRVWSYFDDHTHEYVKCVSTTSNPNDKILISFDLNGGSGAIKSPLFGPNVSIPASYIPTRNGFTFDGWEEIKKDYSGNFMSQIYHSGNTYSFKYSMTLRALWKKVAEQETAICGYPAPQEGCTLVPGKNFNPINNCGLVLSCKNTEETTEETIERTDLFMKPRVYGVGSYQFARSLTKGMRGEDVKMLQKFLNTQGYKVELSGYYGEKTKEALTNFQNAHKAEILDKAGVDQGTGDFYFLTLSFVNELLLNSSSINLNN
jgi:peptidoglycan hydrolase-like protein with peptidoglycan-binding domain